MTVDDMKIVDTIVFHGDCPDGWCSAFVLAQVFPGAKLVPATHGGVLDPFDILNKYVIVVDFSWKREETLRHANSAKKMIILDHHATAKKELEELLFCEFDMNRSGAQLAWDFVHPGVPRPWYVDYVADRDLWNWALPNSEVVTAYLMTLPYTVDGWSHLDKMTADQAVTLGEGAKAHVAHYVEKICAQSYSGGWMGRRVSIANAPYPNCSDVGHELCKRGADIGLLWYIRKDGLMQFSLRSIGEFDVSEMAKKHGGGGHKNAAGFQLEWFTGVSLIRGITGDRL